MTFDKQVMTRSVSLSGDVFDPSGTLTGGSRAHTSSILTKLQVGVDLYFGRSILLIVLIPLIIALPRVNGIYMYH